MDLDALLTPRDGESVSGENLEYDPDFMELQRLALPGEERQVGSEFVTDDEPDFRDLETRALAILERCHDIRAAVILGDALLNTKGLVGFADAMTYIRRCLEEYWDTCYPELDPDDDDDPTMRINAVGGITGPDTTLRYLRRTPLTHSRAFGSATLLMIQQAYGEIAVPEGKQLDLDRAGVAAAFADTDPDDLAASRAAAHQALDEINAIDQLITGVINERGLAVPFKLDDLVKMMRQIVRHLDENAGEDVDAEGDTVDEDDDAMSDVPTAAAPVRRGGGAPGAVETAQDARYALDRVIDYFHRCEPSSPVPVLLERAKRLVGADFLTIMQDMAPQGLENVRLIGGLPTEEEEY